MRHYQLSPIKINPTKLQQSHKEAEEEELRISPEHAVAAATEEMVEAAEEVEETEEVVEVPNPEDPDTPQCLLKNAVIVITSTGTNLGIVLHPSHALG